ncbi:hypothetical protein GCM10010320_40700 [Streptomyces caelestis]|nr:hypothetical protein GCM10010320_40700 [Streptomyces caelestis]
MLCGGAAARGGLAARPLRRRGRRARDIRLGGPFDESARTGPLIPAAHRDRVEAYVARGLAEGAALRCGGSRPDRPDLADGFSYPPTVLD